MGEALAEAKAAVARGERPHAAVAVLDEAMVARGHDRVRETDDPTAHAVVVALREAARRVGKDRLRDVTIFCTMEPCPMCVGALLAATSRRSSSPSRTGPTAPPARCSSLPSTRAWSRRIKVVSGIRRDEVEELYAAAARYPRRMPARRGRPRRAVRRLDRAPCAILPGGEVSEWLMVPLSKSGVREHRGFESLPLRHARTYGRPMPALAPARPRSRT